METDKIVISGQNYSPQWKAIQKDYSIVKLGYQILTADNPTQLAEAVNVAIDDGWCPSGGVAVAHLWDNNRFQFASVWAQAMVRNG